MPPKNIGNEMLEAALYYQEKGFSVIQIQSVENGKCTCHHGLNCSNPGKHPIGNWKHHQETPLSKKEIKSLWYKSPWANVGLVTGTVSNLVVVDIDMPHGKKSLEENGLELPSTVISQTGGGGWQAFFFYPDYECKNKTGVLENIDIRGEGGFVVAPPSLHESGDKYKWIKAPSSTEIISPPGWLFDLVKKEKSRSVDNGLKTTNKNTKPTWRQLTAGTVEEGVRNDTIARLSGHLLAKDVDPYVTLHLMLAFNRSNCIPPLADEEVEKTVDSIAKCEYSKRLES